MVEVDQERTQGTTRPSDLHARPWTSSLSSYLRLAMVSAVLRSSCRHSLRLQVRWASSLTVDQARANIAAREGGHAGVHAFSWINPSASLSARCKPL